MAQLTQLVRRFGMEQRQAPRSLNDLVAAGYLAGVPVAPAGKQFVIDAKSLQVLLK
jgi:DNA-binding IclR family transcriptional regulator